MRGPFLWIGRGREKRILELCDAHIREVLKTVAGMNRAIGAFYGLDSKGVEAGYQDAFKSEREADRLKREILEELSKGVFHPMSRDELIRFVMITDEIAANAKAAVRKLCFVKPKKICKELRDVMKTISSELVNISGKLHEAFTAVMEKPKSAIALSYKVEELEEKIDDLRYEKIFPKLSDWHKAIRDTGLSFMLEKALDNMENVADLCEDASDIVRCIAVV